MSYEVEDKVSTTYLNLGVYGEFLNRSRVKAWRYALDEVVGEDASRDWIVDLGCSYGSWVENYRSLGFARVFGIDSNPEVAAKAADACDRFSAGDSSVLDRVDVPFDLIGCNGVLVHVLEDDEVVRLFEDCRDALPGNGYLLCSGVNSHWWYSSGRRPKRDDFFRVRPREDYESLAERAGMQVEAEIGTFIDPWAARDFESLALDEELRESGHIFTAFERVGDAIRGRQIDPFTELLFVLSPDPERCRPS